MTHTNFTPGTFTTAQLGTPKDANWVPSTQMLVLSTSPGACYGAVKRFDGTPVIVLDIELNKRRNSPALGRAFAPRTIDLDSRNFESVVGSEAAERIRFLFNMLSREFYRLSRMPPLQLSHG